MRVQSSVKTLSWIPSEAVNELKHVKLPFELGFTHYDPPPPETIEDLEALRREDRFRFAHVLEGWARVEDGRIVEYGSSGGGLVGSTSLRVGPAGVTVAAVPLPELKPDPVLAPDGSWVTFRQTAGGRTGLPAPRRVNRKPFVQIASPLAWTTLELTLHADGRSEGRLAGASLFPRHWVYDDSNTLTAKSGVIDCKAWYREAFGEKTPWGDEDSPVVVTAVESALERELSGSIMKGGAKPRVRELPEGEVLMRQGEPGSELFLLLDGVLRVEVNGEALAELGPGSVLGERALLEAGKRTATVAAVTKARVAAVGAGDVDAAKLALLSKDHQREYRR